MPVITAIGFDADDTLWESEIYYVNAKNEAAHLLSAYAPVEQIIADLDVIETHNVQVYGYGFKSFTLSMIETALKISDGKVEGRIIDQILGLAKQALRSEIQLLDGVEEVLGKLSPQYDLFLITKGELFEQQRKIRNSGLMRYFHHARPKHPP
jgi:putative hydrolase of the HAD superfamily